ncbi:MAG: chemotaxis protein CheR [Gammaproteobacteria bacterium]|nr:MAG: chemotaxis protein CheR [Gammaproteobacteria bacterium]
MASREFPITDVDLDRIQSLAYDFTGIVLGNNKKDMIYARLSRRIRSLGLSNFDQYCDLLDQACSVEQSNFINAITTNLTAFFRENHHFDYLRDTVIPELKEKNKLSRKLRIWSAGCSTGEEPYSLAIVLNEAIDIKSWDVKILATDLNSDVLGHAQNGVYDVSRIESIDSGLKEKWFLRDAGNPELVKVKPALSRPISFKRLNLLEGWPMKGRFDVIFCRNVVIYFNKDTQRILFDRYADILADGGYLFIGHSETLHRVSDRFESLGRTIYRKKC